MKASALLRKLKSLGYEEVVEGHRGGGSHKRYEAEGRLPLTWAFHSGVEIPPGLVRKILKTDVGLTDEEAERLLGLRR